MKRMLTIGIVIGILASPAAIAEAAPVVTKKFSNCAALNKVYKGGVASSAAATNAGGKTKYTPTVNAKVYKENRSKDRDGDGIACEK